MYFSKKHRSLVQDIFDAIPHNENQSVNDAVLEDKERRWNRRSF
jgi:hypothetical protein